METIQEIAQWVIDNRYPKSENNKVSDAEMYHTLIEAMNQVLCQPLVSGSLPDANPHTCPECSWLCDCHSQPCSCCSGNDR